MIFVPNSRGDFDQIVPPAFQGDFWIAPIVLGLRLSQCYLRKMLKLRKPQIPSLRYGMTNKGQVLKVRQLQRQPQIPPLRCGMTNKRTGNDKCDDTCAQLIVTSRQRGLARLGLPRRSVQVSFRGSSLSVPFRGRLRLEPRRSARSRRGG